MRAALIAVIVVLAVVGFLDSFYLMLAHYEVVDLHSQDVPVGCDLRVGGCDLDARSDAGSIAGIPSALLGTLYFAGLLGLSATRAVTGKWPVPMLMLPALLAGLSFSGYLLNTIASDVGSPCALCLTAHAVNVAACIAIGVSFYGDGSSERAETRLGATLAQRWRSV